MYQDILLPLKLPNLPNLPNFYILITLHALIDTRY